LDFENPGARSQKPGAQRATARSVAEIRGFGGVAHGSSFCFGSLSIDRKISIMFPSKEIYGLTSQFRRAAVSIPANIAEGYKKRTKPDEVRFLNVAQGSVEECRYYLILSRDLHYCTHDNAQNHLEEISKLLDACINAILTSGS